MVSPRSACPACEAPIAGYDNIPVLSWLILGGKCRKCKAPISPRYAGVELLTGALFVLSYFSAPAMARLIYQQWPLDVTTERICDCRENVRAVIPADWADFYRC